MSLYEPHAESPQMHSNSLELPLSVFAAWIMNSDDYATCKGFFIEILSQANDIEFIIWLPAWHSIDDHDLSRRRAKD